MLRMLNSGDLCKALESGDRPIDRSTLHRWERADPTFPKPILLFNTRRWFADEVDEWIRDHPRRIYRKVIG